MTDQLVQYGLLGICVLGLAGYILKVEKTHSEERSEWRRQQDRQSEEMNRNIRENTSILSSLKTLLENRK